MEAKINSLSAQSIVNAASVINIQSTYMVVHRNYYWQQKNLLTPIVFFLDHQLYNLSVALNIAVKTSFTKEIIYWLIMP